MVAKRIDAGGSNSRRRPATTPEDREKQLGSYAYDLAEKQLLDGSASATVITHFLKAVSIREKAELERLRKENLLTEAKIAKESSGDRMEGLLERALAAFTEYSGKEVVEDVEDEY